MIVGGIVPEPDIAKLKEAGIAAVLTPGATSEQIVAEVAAALAAYASDAITPVSVVLASIVEHSLTRVQPS